MSRKGALYYALMLGIRHIGRKRLLETIERSLDPFTEKERAILDSVLVDYEKEGAPS